MHEDVDPEEENVHSVLDQESAELFSVLSGQSPVVIGRLCGTMPGDAQVYIEQQRVLAGSSANVAITAMLDYVRAASAEVCCSFLQSMCMLCEGIPMHLESRLLSVAGYATTDTKHSPAKVRASLRAAGACEVSSCSAKRADAHPPSPSADEQTIKRKRIDYWEQYNSQVRSWMVRRWENLRERLVTEVQLEDVWVSPRSMIRVRDRPDQTPASADRGNRTPDMDEDYGSMEPRVTLETFLQGYVKGVTVMVGPPGSGKTLLMSCLGHQWARGLGPIPSSYLFVLLEFRQLNLLSRPISLFELLFQHYLPPQGGYTEKRAVLDYLISNPEQSCWVLDGYEEFHSKVTGKDAQSDGGASDPLNRMPVANLISALLNRHILPGCTVVLTCRVQEVSDFEGVSDKVGHLLRWERCEIKEYVANFFAGNANKGVGMQAADLLFSNQHLLAMSTVPALCHICCICMEHLLLDGRDGATRRRSGDRGEQAKKKNVHSAGRDTGGGECCEEKGEGGGRRRRGGVTEDKTTNVKNVSEREEAAPRARPQIPATLTQIYLTVLEAFLCREKPKITTPSQRTVCALSQYQSEVCELSQLAWRGIEENRKTFMAEDISQELLEFSIRTGLFSQVPLRREDGVLVSAYCFIHLTVQEFLAALRLMTSDDVTEAQLKNKFSLRTRWMTRSDQRTIFTDSLYRYVCGLASSACSPVLVQLAGAGRQKWVQKRQALILSLLIKRSVCNTLTGPKLLELCHCVQESQDDQTVKEVVGTRPTVELRNIRLLPSDIDALAFVVNSVGDKGIGLDFKACSMDLECLTFLPRCQYIHHLSFHSRKYDDSFAENLSSILPEFANLRKLEFSRASLTEKAAASLSSALQNCPHIREINLSDNNLKDNGIRFIADIFPKLPRLLSVTLGRNNSSLRGIGYIIEKMASCLNMQHLHADGLEEVTVTFSPNSATESLGSKAEPAISLLNQSWSKAETQSLTQSLARCPVLSVLDLSGGEWDTQSLRTLTQFLPQTRKINVSSSSLGNKGLKTLLDGLPRLSNIQEIDASDNNVSIAGVTTLAAALCSHSNLKQVHISDGGKQQVILKFCWNKSEDNEQLKKFRINKSSLLPSHMTTLCRKLVQCHFHFELEFSHCSMSEEALKNLLKFLPKMTSLHRLNLSHSITSTNKALTTLSSVNQSQRITSVELRHHGDSFVQFDSVKAERATCRLTDFSLSGANLEWLYEILQQVPQLSDLDLSGNRLEDEGVKRIVDFLPRLKIISSVNLSNNTMTQQGALDVASTLCTCQSVSGVEVSLGEEARSLIWFREYGGCEKSLSVTDSSLKLEHLVRIAAIVSNCPSLTTLELRNNLLHSEWIEDFVKRLNSSRCVVSIEERWMKSEAAVGLLSRCLELSRNIRTITVENATLQLSLVKPAEMSSHSCDPSVATEKIGFVNCNVHKYDLPAMRAIVQKCPSLTELIFSHNRLDVEGTDSFSSLLPLLPKLTTLSLSGLMISDGAAQNMVRTFPRLQSLSLSHCEWTKAEGLKLIKALEQCVRLQGLCLDSVRLSEDSMECFGRTLRNIDTLRRLKLNNITSAAGTGEADDVQELLSALEGLTTVEQLELDGWKMADVGLEQLCRLLSGWTDLRKISLSKNLISDQSGAALLEALRSCVHLEELHLSGNSLGDLTAARMASVLPSLTRITVFDISENRIGNEGAVSLAKAISRMNNLTKIHLTAVGTSQLCAVAASLSHCPRLQDVSLGWNSCGDAVVLELARVLPLCRRLSRINLDSNSVSVIGAEALVRALQSCPALHLISLWRNKISSTEAQKLRLRDRRLNFSLT